MSSMAFLQRRQKDKYVQRPKVHIDFLNRSWIRILYKMGLHVYRCPFSCFGIEMFLKLVSCILEWSFGIDCYRLSSQRIYFLDKLI